MIENGVNSLSQLLENGKKKDRPGAVDAAHPTLRHSEPKQEVSAYAH